MGGTGSSAKVTCLVAPLAYGVTDADLRKALHHVHVVAPESMRPAMRVPGGLTRGMGGRGAASAGRLTPDQSITGKYAYPVGLSDAARTMAGCR